MAKLILAAMVPLLLGVAGCGWGTSRFDRLVDDARDGLLSLDTPEVGDGEDPERQPGCPVWPETDVVAAEHEAAFAAIFCVLEPNQTVKDGEGAESHDLLLFVELRDHRRSTDLFMQKIGERGTATELAEVPTDGGPPVTGRCYPSATPSAAAAGEQLCFAVFEHHDLQIILSDDLVGPGRTDITTTLAEQLEVVLAQAAEV